MTVIKRYSNRKLYDTEAKRYVTLDEIAEAIRRDEDVRVVDHVSGEDLTTLTMLQILFEQEKRIGGLMSQGLLSRLIRAGEGTWKGLREAWSASLDPAQRADNEIADRLRRLIELKQLSEEEGRRMVDLLLSLSPRRQAVSPDAEAAGPAPQPESAPEEEGIDPELLEDLQTQVEKLEAQVKALRAAKETAEIE